MINDKLDNRFHFVTITLAVDAFNHVYKPLYLFTVPWTHSSVISQSN